MIELNLLPDVKLEYLKAERSRRLITSIAVLVTIGSVGILVLLLSFSAIQKKNLSDLNSDISKQTKTLQAQPGIDKVLTVQNQLNRLTELHAAKPTAAKIFDYVNQLTPSQVSINSLTIDFTKQTILITGSADALSSVNKYLDTIKYTKYTTAESSTPTKAFSNVVLTSFGISTANAKNGKPASFAVGLSYDPPIFDLTKKVTLAVPSITTTRASLDANSDLFQAAPPTKKGN